MNCKIKVKKLDALQAGGLLSVRRSREEEYKKATSK
jgi:hypothetical protein